MAANLRRLALTVRDPDRGQFNFALPVSTATQRVSDLRHNQSNIYVAPLPSQIRIGGNSQLEK